MLSHVSPNVRGDQSKWFPWVKINGERSKPLQSWDAGSSLQRWRGHTWEADCWRRSALRRSVLDSHSRRESVQTPPSFSSGPPQPRASLRRRERVPGPCEAEVGVGGRCWRAIKGGRPCRVRRGRHSGRWSCRLRRGRRMRLGSGGGWARTERVGPVGGRRWSLSRRRRRRRHRRRRPRWKRKGGGYN